MKSKFNPYSLRYRMLIVLGCSVLSAVLLFLFMNALSSHLINTYYLSEAAYLNRTTQYAARFETYVKDNNLSTNNLKALKLWVRQNPYSYITLYDENEVVWESGWWDDKIESSLIYPESSSEVQPYSLQSSITVEDTKVFYDGLFPIEFSNGTYWLSVTDFSEETIMNFTSKAISAFCIFFIFPVVLLYSSKISNKIIQLTNEVNIISLGNLNGSITKSGKDEIGILAQGVDKMRQSVIEQIEKERLAISSNNDLITSMSHDIRTPLTVLLGYTGLIKNQQYSSQEEFNTYIDVIDKKANQLKELSDRLFKYFLVFGDAGPAELEPVNADSLLMQIIGEHTLLLEDSGFSFSLPKASLNCIINVEPIGVKRLFDNVFSNIEKYADKDCPCKISTLIAENWLQIFVTNKICSQESKAESTRIGLKSCSKIMERMNGSFSTSSAKGFFTVCAIFPLAPKDLK